MEQQTQTSLMLIQGFCGVGYPNYKIRKRYKSVFYVNGKIKGGLNTWEKYRAELFQISRSRKFKNEIFSFEMCLN